MKRQQKSRSNSRSRNNRPQREPDEYFFEEAAPRAVVRVPPKLVAKTENQKKYIAAIQSFKLIFGLGPAGTGKTHLATSIAAELLANRKIEKFIITRPAVEAGESLGFLPGELEEKYAPYLAPVMQILCDYFGKSHVENLIKLGKIEAIPLGFMRGMAEPLTNLIPTPNGYVSMGDLLMTTWTHRTIIVPDAVVVPARMACEALAGAGGSGMYSVPLSPTGELPATHWISSGLIEQSFADLLANPDALAAVATSAGLDPGPLLAIVAAADISDEPADVALSRLGLKLVTTP